LIKNGNSELQFAIINLPVLFKKKNNKRGNRTQSYR